MVCLAIACRERESREVIVRRPNASYYTWKLHLQRKGKEEEKKREKCEEIYGGGGGGKKQASQVRGEFEETPPLFRNFSLVFFCFFLGPTC